MAIDDKELLIRVRADIRKAVRDLKKLSGEVAGTGKSAGVASKSTRQLGLSMGSLAQAAAGYLSLRLAYSLLQQADAFNVLQGRIKNATRETGDYVKVSRELYNISNANGVALADTVDVFQRLSQSRQDLGATNDELLQLTDLVQKLGVVSGASNSALSAGLLQFGQGLSAGIFRAEEFNSILENIPALAKAMAEGMGKTAGELRQMVLDGKLLSTDVMQALISQSEDINQQFSAMPDSMARASTTLSNSWSRFLAALDKASNGTGVIAEYMREISNIMDYWTSKLEKSDIDKVGEKLAETNARLQRLIERGISETSYSVRKLKEQLRELREEYAALTMGPPRPTPEQSGTAGGKPEPIDAEEQKRIESIRKLVATLEDEAATVGMTRQEIVLYKLEQMGASDADLQRARSAVESTKAIAEQAASLSAAQAVWRETRTDMEKMAEKMVELDKLYAEGAISFDTYSRAMFEAQASVEGFVENSVNEFDRLESAIKGWGDQFTNTLADMVTEGKFNFKDLADSIINDLLRIMIYKNITAPLLASFGVGVNHSGGLAGAGSGTFRNVSPLVFAGAPRYHRGGFAGLRSDEVPAILQRGEEVLPRTDPRHAANLRGGGGIKVEINNNGTPSTVTGVSQSMDGRDLVVSVMLEDLQRGGAYSSALAGRFKLER